MQPWMVMVMAMCVCVREREREREKSDALGQQQQQYRRIERNVIGWCGQTSFVQCQSSFDAMEMTLMIDIKV
jgi:hypothetical protein